MVVGLLNPKLLNVETAIGASAAFYSDALWNKWSGHTQFRLAENPLSFLEHYHIGLGLLAIGNNFADGAGTYFVASELFHDDPFGLKKASETKSKNLSLGSILMGLVLLRLSR